jgi:glycerol-3-phosphate cytidylyltransferase
MNISIVGAGTWGTALANLLCHSGHNVLLWSAIEDEIKYISTYHKHPNLKDANISESIQLTINIEDCVNNHDIIVLAVPSVYVRETAAKISQFITNNQIIVDVAKGIEPQTLFTMSEVIYDEINKTTKFDYGQIVALSGPTHAEEVARNLPTTIVSACTNEKNAKIVQEVFSTDFMRVYTNDDIKGVELSGSLKNIIALAAGISHGLGYGDNAIAALITRGIHEISRLGIAMNGQLHTFYGLAGVGDLIVTCTSLHSRNNKCGMYIGNGIPVDEAIKKVGMVVEGINALDAAYELSIKYNVELPIIRSVFDVVKFNLSPKISVKRLFDREKKGETPFSILENIYDNVGVKNREDNRMKRVITYGTFDLLHYGHINLLRRAKALGDYLIVALSTDDFVALQKNKECYFNYAERKLLLESMRYVDLVIPEDDWNQKISDCKQYHIDTFVMGDDWEGKFDYLKEEGIEVIYLPRTPEVSTTRIKDDLNNK